MTEEQILALKNSALAVLKARLPSCCTYHNSAHAERVFRAAEKLGRLEGLSPVELEDLRLAAVFHDFGYIESMFDNEKLAAKYMFEVGTPYGIDGARAERLAALVRETAYPYAPQSRLGKILCDADIEYVGDRDFEHQADCFRMELARQGKEFSDREWYEFEIRFLEGISFFTATGRQLYEAGRTNNLAALRNRLAAATEK